MSVCLLEFIVCCPGEQVANTYQRKADCLYTLNQPNGCLNDRQEVCPAGKHQALQPPCLTLDGNDAMPASARDTHASTGSVNEPTRTAAALEGGRMCSSDGAVFTMSRTSSTAQQVQGRQTGNGSTTWGPGPVGSKSCHNSNTRSIVLSAHLITVGSCLMT